MERLNTLKPGDSVHVCVEAVKNGLREARIDNWLYESIWLVCSAFDMNQSELSIRKIPEGGLEKLDVLVEQRIKRVPLQYILGEQEFMGRDFAVGEGVLIPRPDTQSLVIMAQELIGERKLRVLDLCTGSGCIAISTKLACPLCSVTASDISDQALSYARENGGRLNADVRWINSDLFENIPGRYDVILCNPPYIMDEEVLQPEVGYEPDTALFGGVDGLDFYRRLNVSMHEHLNHNGVAILECGETQANKVYELLIERYTVEIHNDMFGCPRIILAKSRGNI